ncbi:MAG: hypothetical protein IIV43_00265, partial [Oscillospiraceae bacterium]|nr:hypothetical protein [Oscillospiraceae bacterium]
MKKRLFSLFLAVLMICTLLPTSALAAQYNTSVALADLAPGDMVAVGTEITGLTNGLSVLYFSCDQVFFVDKNYSGASCIVEGSVVNSSNTASISAPENRYWRVGSVDASNLSLVSTD